MTPSHDDQIRNLLDMARGWAESAPVHILCMETEES